MVRSIISLSLLGFLIGQAKGQNTQANVFQDSQGRILTTLYNTVRVNNFAYTKTTLLGSPFLTYPVWQQGTVQVDKHNFPCKLAYNLVTGEVLCQLEGDSTIKPISPDAFTINGREFVRQSGKAVGMDYHRDFAVLYQGQTKLFMNMTKKIDAGFTPNTNNLGLTNNGYNQYGNDSGIQGSYQTLTSYYIQKGKDQPKIVALNKKSVLRILSEQADKLSGVLPTKNLTPGDLERAVAYYDQLMAENREHN